jgi:glycosyltransferase involved in cell wall biosynthesis
VKLLQVVWNFPDTVMQPFDMYYFYWPVREAAKRDWQAEVLTFQVTAEQPRTEVIDGITVRRCPAGTRRGRPFSWDFIRALLTTDADIIACHGYGEGRSELAILLGRLRGKPVIFTPHFHVYLQQRPLREFYDKTVGRLMFGLSSRVIVFTAYTHHHLRHLGIRSDKLCILPHVSRPEVFQTQPGEPEVGTLLREAGIMGKPLLLGVGQLIERKGWAYTLECLPALVARFPEMQFLVIGPSQPAEPAFRTKLLQRAAQLGVSQHLYILQDNTPAFIRDAYRCATLLTHPSFVESFGMVLLEAMTAGVPIVAHNGTGIPCIVQDGITGYVVDVRDTDAYTAALLRVLNDPEHAQAIGQAGRQQALTRFSQATIAEQLFALYTEVIDRNSDSHIGNDREQAGLPRTRKQAVL